MTEPTPQLDEYQCKRFISSLAAIISNTLHNFWLSRSDATDAMNDCFRLLRELLDQVHSVELKIINSRILLNGQKLDDESDNVAFLIDHLQDLEVQNFTITQDATSEDFINLCEIIEARAEQIERLGGFVDFVTRSEITGISSRKVVIRELEEQEVVLTKDELAAQRGSGTDVANIIAFLKGGVEGTAGDKIADNVAKAATDPAQMASLIMQSADIRQSNHPLEDTESLLDFVVGSMRKTFSTLQQSKSARTKTGRKRITKNLLLLEDEVLKRMREMSEDWSEDDLEEITKAVTEMTDEMKIDGLADDYMHQRKTVEKSEAQLLDFIKSKGIENVEDIAIKQKLIEKGLSIDGWRELVIKTTSENAPPSGNTQSDSSSEEALGGLGMTATTSGGGIRGGFGTGEGGLGGLMDAISKLDSLLNNMEKQFSSPDGTSHQDDIVSEITDMFAAVNQQVDTLVGGVERGITGLLTDINTDSANIDKLDTVSADKRAKLHTTRRKVLQDIFLLVRSISEPLALINTSLTMVQSKSFGSVNERQSSVLKVAQSNTDRISDVLTRLSGVADDATSEAKQS